jgi:nucleotide-binding universal stress UspA family protein
MENPTAKNEPWDVVDEASYESFPASDPPGWGSYHATTPPEATPEAVVVPAPVVFVVADLDSPRCDEALRHADVEARVRGGKLVVCHLRSARSFAFELAGRIAHVANTTQRDPSTFEVETAIGRARTIVARAEAHGAELIVVRAPDRKRFASHLVQRVVRYAKCSVLVVRPTYGMNILVATDLADDTTPTLSAATRETELLDAPVTTLHCVKTDERATSAVEAMHRLARLAQQHRLGAEVSVIAGAPANTIVNAAYAIGADLVIMATHGRTRLWRMLQPSVAEQVVRRAPGSVLIVRSEALAKSR